MARALGASGAGDAGREWVGPPMLWLAEHQRARKYDRADLCCGMIPLLGAQGVAPPIGSYCGIAPTELPGAQRRKAV
ncbi:hypothetical protein GT039_41640 [Streptomyces sp. SID2955]|nr:hypothetical protein [Streptomyces sp. SID2955]